MLGISRRTVQRLGSSGGVIHSQSLHILAPSIASPPRPAPPTWLTVDSIVCAAAEAMQAPPAAVRDVLRAAFARARGLGLTVEEVDDALSPPGSGPPAPGQTDPRDGATAPGTAAPGAARSSPPARQA